MGSHPHAGPAEAFSPVSRNPGPLSLSYYDPVPDRMLPNDDLDLQVVWLETIRRRGLPVDRGMLADAWLEHIHLWPDEYGVASRNLTQELYPPVSGWFDNGFTAGMGAAIRTEIWACLAPGDPELAAALAREDACVDHAKEGLYAAEYLAALESYSSHLEMENLGIGSVRLSGDYLKTKYEFFQLILLEQSLSLINQQV